MTFLRTTLRTARLPAFRPVTSYPSLLSTRRYAFSSYGGGEGDPKGENPQDQGASQSEHLEHPGPPSPAGGGKSDGGSSGSNPGSGAGSKSDGSGSQGKGKGKGGGLDGEGDKAARGPKGGAQPKILDTAPPGEPGEDVDQHNKEFEQRHDRAENKINPDGKDNVGKGFWSGQGGADRQP